VYRSIDILFRDCRRSVSGLLRNRVYALSASANDTFLVRLLKPDSTALFLPRVDILDSPAISFSSSTPPIWDASNSPRPPTGLTSWW